MDNRKALPADAARRLRSGAHAYGRVSRLCHRLFGLAVCAGAQSCPSISRRQSIPKAVACVHAGQVDPDGWDVPAARIEAGCSVGSGGRRPRTVPR